MITINGIDSEISTPTTLPKLLREIGLADKPVVIELNEQAVSPSEFDQHEVQSGDRVEIIAIAAGG